MKHELLITAQELFDSPGRSATTQIDGASDTPIIYSSTFAAENMSKAYRILQMTEPPDLIQQWERCIRNAVSAREEMKKDIGKMQEIATQIEKRCFDYEPFVREYLTALGKEGLLEESLNMTG